MGWNWAKGSVGWVLKKKIWNSTECVASSQEKPGKPYGWKSLHSQQWEIMAHDLAWWKEGAEIKFTFHNILEIFFATQVILWQVIVLHTFTHTYTCPSHIYPYSSHMMTEARWHTMQLTWPMRFQFTDSFSPNHLPCHQQPHLPPLVLPSHSFSQFSFISHILFHEPLYLCWCPPVGPTGPLTPTSRWVRKG